MLEGANVKHRLGSAKAARDEVTIIGSARSGLSWRIYDEGGTPVAVRPGRVVSLDVDSPEGRAAYEAAVKAVNTALKIARSRAKAENQTLYGSVIRRINFKPRGRKAKHTDVDTSAEVIID